MKNDEENRFAAALKSRSPRSRTGPMADQGAGDRRQVHVGAYFSPEVARQLKVMGAEEGTTIRMLMAEALDLLFASRGKPEIAREPSRDMQS